MVTDVVSISLKAQDMYKGSQGLIEAAAGLETEIEALHEEERLLLVKLSKVRKAIHAKEAHRISCLATAEIILNKTEQAATIAHRVQHFYGH